MVDLKIREARLIIYFVVFLICIRVSLWFVPISSTIYTDSMHHIYIGALIFGAYLILTHTNKYKFFFSKFKLHDLGLFVYAASLAMIADELIFMFTGGYWSMPSLVGAFVVSSFVVAYYAIAYRKKSKSNSIYMMKA
jgi:hypothetical protein